MTRRHIPLYLAVLLLLICGCSSYLYEPDLKLFNPGTYTVVVPGYSEDIRVTTTFSKSRVTKIAIAPGSETDGRGGEAMQAVANAIIANQGFNVDIVSGATYSSWAVLEAVSAAAQLAGADVRLLQMPQTESNSDEKYAPPYAPGIYYGTAQGYGGEINVAVEVSEEGIVSITAEGLGESAGIGSNALALLPDRIRQSGSPEIDGLSGATYTSDAIKSAVSDALAQAKLAIANTSEK